jgi:hypothetical protein
VTDVPVLNFLGLTWQWTRGSALIGWVKDDAAFSAERIAASDGAKTRSAPSGASALSRRRRDRQGGSGNRCMTIIRTDTAVRAPTVPTSIEAGARPAPEVVELSDGDEFELRIAPGDQGARRHSVSHARLQRLDPGTRR